MTVSRSTKRVLVSVSMVAAAIILLAIGFGVGYDSSRGSIDCKPGVVLAVEVTGVDAFRNGNYVLTVGDCERIDEEAFIAAVQALTTPATTESTTTEPSDGEAEADG